MFVLVLEYEQVYMENLPSSEAYEHSYMHRDVITHIVVSRYTQSSSFPIKAIANPLLILYH